jgi:hypothetical protein
MKIEKINPLLEQLLLVVLEPFQRFPEGLPHSE